MFSRENSKLQMLETEHVNKRKQAFTNQYPVGDDVSQRTADAEGSAVLGMLILPHGTPALVVDLPRRQLSDTDCGTVWSSWPVSSSAYAGRMKASRSSTSSLNAAAIFATWMPNVPRNSPSALPKVQLWMPQPLAWWMPSRQSVPTRSRNFRQAARIARNTVKSAILAQTALKFFNK
jgi:hypothetical protein